MGYGGRFLIALRVEDSKAGSYSEYKLLSLDIRRDYKSEILNDSFQESGLEQGNGIYLREDAEVCQLWDILLSNPNKACNAWR